MYLIVTNCCLLLISVGFCDLYFLINFFLLGLIIHFLSFSSSSQSPLLLPLCPPQPPQFCLLTVLCVVTNSSLNSPPEVPTSSQYFQMHQRLMDFILFLAPSLLALSSILVSTGPSLRTLPASLDLLLTAGNACGLSPGLDRLFSGLHIFLFFFAYSLTFGGAHSQVDFWGYREVDFKNFVAWKCLNSMIIFSSLPHMEF